MKVLKHTARILTFVLLLPSLGSQTGWAYDLDLGVYGQGGFDMVSSQPPPGAASTVSSPAPSGPSYGVGVSSEFLKFANDMVGIGALLGFGGVSASWKSSDTGKSPSAVAISSMGVDLAGRGLIHFGDFRAFLYGGLLYGLFGNSYRTTVDGSTADPDGILEYKVQSIMRLTGGIGAGYEMGDFAVDLQGGLNSISLNVTTPERGTVKSANVTDTYTGFTFGIVASYRLMGGKPAKPDDTAKEERRRKKPDGDNKKKGQKKKTRKKKKVE